MAEAASCWARGEAPATQETQRSWPVFRTGQVAGFIIQARHPPTQHYGRLSGQTGVTKLGLLRFVWVLRGRFLAGSRCGVGIWAVRELCG